MYVSLASLRPQIHPQQQVSEVRVVAEGVLQLTCPERNQVGCMFLVGFLQPFKHLVPLIKRHIECCKASRCGDTSALLVQELGFFTSLVSCLSPYELGDILPIYLVINA